MEIESIDEKEVKENILDNSIEKLSDTLNNKLDKDTILQASQKPASETLPTKESKNLKPYIIAGVLVVGILIASRLFSKK